MPSVLEDRADAKAELDSLLQLAEELQEKVRREHGWIDVFWLVLAALILLHLWATLAWLNFVRWLVDNPSGFLLWMVIGLLPGLFYLPLLASRIQRSRRRLMRDEEALYGIVRFLRESEGNLAMNMNMKIEMSVAERARFECRLARFGIGPTS